MLFEGRFWAEEGKVYFHHAFEDASPGDLMFVYTRAGYYHLFANVATWVASNVPLADAPLVTGWLSFAVLAAVVWVALFWPSELLPTTTARIAAATLLVVGTLASGDVWLNTLHTQVYLGILAVLLLFVDVQRVGVTRFAFGAIALGVAGLSGLYAAVLAPLYVVRAYLERSGRRALYAGVLATAALVQFAVIAGSRASGEISETKLHVPSVGTVARSAAWQVGAFLFGSRGGPRTLRFARAHGDFGLVVVALCAVAVVAFVALLVSRSTTVRTPILLGGAFVLSELLVNLGANGQLAERRYAVVPNAILTLAVVYGAAATGANWRGFAATALCGLVAIAGLASFWRDDPPGTYLRCVACPDWDDEVRAWESGETDELEIWPYPEWSMSLRNPSRGTLRHWRGFVVPTGRLSPGDGFPVVPHADQSPSGPTSARPRASPPPGRW